MKDNLRSKPLMEGSILTTIVFILMMISNVPGLYILGSILVPIPVAILYIKYKWKISILSVIVSTIITTLFLGPVMGLSTGLSTFLIGIPLGIGISKKSGNLTLGYVFVGSFISTLINLLLTVYLVMGVTMDGFLNSLVTQYQQSADIILKASNNPQAKEAMDKMLSYVTVDNLKIILPIGLVVVAFVSAICIFIIAKRILVRLRMPVASVKSFTQWFINPIPIAVIVIIALIGIELKNNAVPYGDDIFMWAVGIGALLCVLQGLSLIMYMLLERLRMNKVAAVIIAIILITSGLIIYVAPIGLIDIILDYRSLEENSLGSMIRKKLDPNNK